MLLCSLNRAIVLKLLVLTSLLATIRAEENSGNEKHPLPIKEVSPEIYKVESKSENDDAKYNLFHPVPKAKLRDLSDVTGLDTPYTLDAGHFLLDMGLFNFEANTVSIDSVRERNLELVPFSFKLGLLNNLDAELSFNPYNIDSYKERKVGQRLPNGRKENPGRTRITEKGFGDIQFNLKYNVWGNDDGDSALAVAAFLKMPTNQGNVGNKYFEGGLLLPFEVDLPRDWSLSFTSGVEVRHDIQAQHFHAEFVNSLGFSHALTQKLDGSIEFGSLFSTERGAKWQGTIDLGLTYEISKNVLFSSGVNFGVTRAAQGIGGFTGFSFRF